MSKPIAVPDPVPIDLDTLASWSAGQLFAVGLEATRRLEKFGAKGDQKAAECLLRLTRRGIKALSELASGPIEPIPNPEKPGHILNGFEYHFQNTTERTAARNAILKIARQEFSWPAELTMHPDWQRHLAKYLKDRLELGAELGVNLSPKKPWKFKGKKTAANLIAFRLFLELDAGRRMGRPEYAKNLPPFNRATSHQWFLAAMNLLRAKNPLNQADCPKYWELMGITIPPNHSPTPYLRQFRDSLEQAFNTISIGSSSRKEGDK